MTKLFSVKTIVLFIAITCISLGSNAQGIEFFKGTFEEAKLEATKQNKPLFVDVYASWCGPCKMLSKLVFTKKEVGDYFNKSFINFKLQTDEKGTNNKDIASKYDVVSYPTLMWLDGNGKVMHISTGYKTVNALIAEAHIVFDKDKRIGSAVTKWNKGDRSLHNAINYFKINKNSKYEFEEFFNNLSEKEKLDNSVFKLLIKLRNKLKTDGEAFKFIVKNREKYITSTNSYELKMVIDRPILNELIENQGTNDLESTIKKYKDLEYSQLDYFVKKAELKYYIKKSDFAAFRKSAIEAIAQFSTEKPQIYGEVLSELYSSDRTNFSEFKNPEIILDWAKFKDPSLEGKTTFDLLKFFAYVILDEKEKAIKLGDDYLKDNKGKRDPFFNMIRPEIDKIR